MRHRLAGAILLLYPRRVREGHGPEILSLLDDLIAHEGRSRAGLFMRLALDGMVQRIASTATAWTVVAVLVTTSFGGLAVSNFAAANAFHVAPRTGHAVAPASAASWTIQPTAGADGRADSSLTAVSCTSASFCMTVGSADDGAGDEGSLTGVESLAESWDGMAWTVTAGPGPAGPSPGLYAISCTSPTFCVAVGSTVAGLVGGFRGGGWGSSNPGHALVEAWNGTTWTVQATPAGAVAHTELSGVSCVSSTSCVVVGARGVGRYRQYALVETWNGRSWNERALASTGKYGTWLTSISCVAADWCTAVGGVANAYYDGPPGSGIPAEQPIADRWNGHRWITSTLQGVGPIEIEVGRRIERVSQGDVTGVSCPSRSFCLASGSFQLSQSDQSPEAFARRWNGHGWTKAVTGLSRFAQLDGVSCQSSSECFTAGTAYGAPEAPTGWSTPLVAGWNGRRWSRVSLPLTPAASGGRSRGGLAGVSCVPSAECTAVGEQPSGAYDATLVQGDGDESSGSLRSEG